MTRTGLWKIKYTTMGGEPYAVVECPVCKQSLQSTDVNKCVFTHCGGKFREVLSESQQDELLGRSGPNDLTASEQSAAANLVAAEAAAQSAKPQYWDSQKEWEAVAAQVEFDAGVNATRKQAMELAELTGTKFPQQPGPRIANPRVPYDPNTKTV